MSESAISPMNVDSASAKQLILEFRELRARLEEAEQTLDAIRSGDVDALVVSSDEGEKVYTLKGADEPYRIFVEQMHEGAVTLSSDGTILYCNQAFANMAGSPLERVIGTALGALLCGREGEVVEDLPAYLTTRESSETMGVRRMDRVLPVLVSAAKMVSEEAPALALTVTDLSQQQEQEEKLKKANEELEGFCYTVSHDLRAPLRSIVSSANVIMEDFGDTLPSDARVDLVRIGNSANQLGSLIDDLLMYSRLSSLPIEAANVDLSAFAREIASSIGLPGADKIEWVIQDHLIAKGDAGLLRLVLENLMSNAAKYSSKTAKPRIEIGAIEGQSRPVFFVRDNGIGFDISYLDRIFLPFERLHGRDYPGTGIGLANAKRIVTRHKGTIWAESQPGQGATFYFQSGLD